MVGNCDRSLMGFDQTLGDRKPKSASAGIPGASMVTAKRDFEHSIKVISGNAATLIGHPHDDDVRIDG